MKKIIIVIIALLVVRIGLAQDDKNNVKFELGKGLDVNLNQGEYHFNLSGFLRMYGGYRNEKDGENEARFGVNDAYLSLGGGLLHNKFTFFLQTNFADQNPLMDAWVAYHWKSYLTVTAGQKQTFTNNREIMMHEQGLSMMERSIVSRYFSATGRELGIFLESRLWLGKMILKPAIAVTTGDGRNSFGSSSVDVDLGGLKYGGRLDFLPLGDFKKGNDIVGADFMREATPKLLIGGAMSYNDGASNKVGEGHGDYVMYDKDGKTKFPALRKVSADVLFKWQGFSVLAEYVNSTATHLTGLQTKATGDSPLQPEEIANYLCLGSGYNVQLGYVFSKGWALDTRFSKIVPEFSETVTSALRETNEYSVSVSKYFIDNRLVCQGWFSYLENPKLNVANANFRAELSVAVVF